MTANMKIIIIRTTVRLDNAGKVLAMMVKISFSDFQDLANLKTRRSLRGKKRCKIIIKIRAINIKTSIMCVCNPYLISIFRWCTYWHINKVFYDSTYFR